MIDQIFKVAVDLKDKVNNIVEYQKVLKECTSNENWNIANTKLQVLADHSYNWNDYNVIMKHLWQKLNCPPKEWRRIFKTLNAMDYLIKNGAPRVIQEIKDDLFKIRALQDFSYKENGVDKGQGVRDKSRAICELLNDPQKLQEEREFAKQTRNKFMGISSSGETSGQGVQNRNYGSAAPASGKYGGFGSEDISRLGYKEGQFNQPYDPYTREQSKHTSKPESDTHKKKHHHKDEDEEAHKKKKKHKKKKDSDSEEESDDDEEEDSSDSETEKKSKKKKVPEKEESKGLGKAPKAGRALGGASGTTNQNQTQNQPQVDLMDLLDTPSSTKQNAGIDLLSMPSTQQPPQQQPPTSGLTDIFSSMNINTQPAQQTQPPQNIFANLNVGGQQQNFFGQPTPPAQQQQQPVSGFIPQPTMQQPSGFFNMQNQQQQQQQQPQAFTPSPFGMQQQQQAQTNMFQNMNVQPTFQASPQKTDPFGGFQSAPTTSSNQPSFGSSTFSQSPNTNNSAQKQSNIPVSNNNSNQWQPKNQSAWGDGAGLFDLNNLNAGNKSLLETQKAKPHGEPNLLHTKDTDLDSLWSGAKSTVTSTTSQSMGQGFQGQQNKFVPNINPNSLFQPQPQVPQQPYGMGIGGQFGRPAAGGFVPQQPAFGAMPGMTASMGAPMGSQFGNNMGGMGALGSGLNFQPPQFYGQQQNQQQNPMGMMGQQQKNTGFGQFQSGTPNTMGNQAFGGIGNTNPQGSGGFNFM